MSTPFRGNLIFLIYAIIAVIIGVRARSSKQAFYLSFAVGLVVCVALFFFKVFVEMGGIFHVFSFAAISSIIRRLKGPKVRSDAVSKR